MYPEWIAVLNPSAGNQRFFQLCVRVHVHMCTRMHYAAIHVSRPSDISQAATIAVNRTQGVKL